MLPSSSEKTAASSTSARPIDYSRWENLLSSDEEDENEVSSRSPVVQRFDSPLSVTLGPKGAVAAASQTAAAEEERRRGQMKKEDEKEKRRKRKEKNEKSKNTDENPSPSSFYVSSSSSISSSSSLSITSSSSSSSFSRVDEEFASMVRNGDCVKCRQYFWCQSHDEVTAFFCLPKREGGKELRGKEIQVNVKSHHLEIIVPSSSSSSFRNEEMKVLGKKEEEKNVLMLKKEFPFKVEESEDLWMWEVKSLVVDWKKLEEAARREKCKTDDPLLAMTSSSSSPPSVVLSSSSSSPPSVVLSSSSSSPPSVVLSSSSSSPPSVVVSSSSSSPPSVALSSSSSSPPSVALSSSSSSPPSVALSSSSSSPPFVALSSSSSSPPSVALSSSSSGPLFPSSYAEVEASKRKVLVLSLRKVSEMSGVIIWWNCLFKGDPEIDVRYLPDRLEKKEGRQKRSEAFQEAWKEAHRGFLDKMAKRKEESGKTEEISFD